jgi:predicted metal-dependent enzyme (double-stranded beta helix superfamily)
MQRFDTDRFVESCISAAAGPDRVSAVREVVLDAVRESGGLETAFPVPIPDGDDDGVLYQSADLLVACPIFPRQFKTGIHDHTVPAVIGVWSGYEDNHLYERVGHGLRALRVERTTAGNVLVLGTDAIHDVHAPDTTHSAALHVYLGDITATERRFWIDTESDPMPFDGEEHERRWMEAALATGLVAPPVV